MTTRTLRNAFVAVLFAAGLCATMQAGKAQDLAPAGLPQPVADDCIDMVSAPWTTKDREAIKSEFNLRVSGFGVRVVLAVGNDYPNQTGPKIVRLTNAANDAAWVSRYFKDLHYDVLYVKNARMNDLIDAALAIQRHRSNEGLAIFYFAGHGFSLAGVNYIVTADLADGDTAHIGAASRSPTEILALMAGNRSSILLLDSCRNDLSTVLSAGTFVVNEAIPPGAIADYAANAGETAFDWPENPDHHGLFASAIGAVLRNTTWVRTHPFDSVFENINSAELSHNRRGQLQAAGSIISPTLSPDDDWQSIVAVSNAFLNSVQSGLVNVATQPGFNNCTTAEIYFEELMTLDGQMRPGGDQIVATRDQLRPFVDQCAQQLVSASSESVLSELSIPAIPVVVTTAANQIAPTEAGSALGAIPLGPQLKLQGRLALYDPMGTISTLQTDMNSPARQVKLGLAQLTAAQPSVLPPVLSTVRGMRVFASLQDAPTLVSTKTQIILEFSNQLDTALLEKSTQDIGALITGAPWAGNVSKYLIVFPPSGQGPDVGSDVLRHDLIKVLWIERALAAHGVKPGQIVEPNLARAPVLPFSNLADNQAVLIRVDPQSSTRTPTARSMIQDKRQTYDWLKKMFSDLSK